jgi:hypothetical protein
MLRKQVWLWTQRAALFIMILAAFARGCRSLAR